MHDTKYLGEGSHHNLATARLREAPLALAPLSGSPSPYLRACAQHDGDGCMLANGVLSLSPVKSHVWFDATHGPSVPGLPHFMMLALRQALNSYQCSHMLLLIAISQAVSHRRTPSS